MVFHLVPTPFFLFLIIEKKKMKEKRKRRKRKEKKKEEKKKKKKKKKNLSFFPSITQILYDLNPNRMRNVSSEFLPRIQARITISFISSHRIMFDITTETDSAANPNYLND